VLAALQPLETMVWVFPVSDGTLNIVLAESPTAAEDRHHLPSSPIALGKCVNCLTSRLQVYRTQELKELLAVKPPHTARPRALL